MGLYDHLREFVTVSTKHFDDSHNYAHAHQVYMNACLIAEQEMPGYDHNIITYAAYLHDVCDHKYPKSIHYDELVQYIHNALSSDKAAFVLELIANISFSKEQKRRLNGSHRVYDDDTKELYLNILADADRLEAIGKIGIERCIGFTVSHGGKVPEDVKQHCHEKLARLLPENFIKTHAARKMAEPLHQEILDYMNLN